MSSDQEPKKTRGRPRGGQYGAGGGAPKLTARIEEQEILTWIKAFPGGTAGVLRAAYASRAKLTNISNSDRLKGTQNVAQQNRKKK